MAAIKELNPSRLILVKHESKKGSEPEKEQKENEELLRKTVGVVTEIEVVTVPDPYDVFEVAKATVKLIEKEHGKGHSVYLNITGGRRTQGLGVLFAGYARRDMLRRIVYATEEENKLIDLPVLSFGITKTKRALLEELAREPENMSELAKKLGKTRGMIYQHLNDLKSRGFIDESYKLTVAGRLALL